MKESEKDKTWFEGTLFRSQLEARWRLYYSEMDLACDYEEGPVDFEAESFEPDFFLRQGYWTIVKGTFPKAEDKTKARALAQRSGYPVYFFFGDIPHSSLDDELWYSASALAFFPDGTTDEAYWWCECPFCHSAGVQFEGRAANLACGCLKIKAPGKDFSHYHSERILSAYRNAREADVITGSIDGHDELKKPIYVPFPIDLDLTNED